MVQRLRRILKRFIDKVYKVLMIMGLMPVEKEELNPYKLKGFVQLLFDKWKEEMVILC